MRLKWLVVEASAQWPGVRVMLDHDFGPFVVFHDGDQDEDGTMRYTTLVRDRYGNDVAKATNVVAPTKKAVSTL